MSNDRILSTKTQFQGWLNFLLAEAELGGKTVERPLVEHPSGSSLLAYDPDRKVAFTVTNTRLAVLHVGGEPLLEGVAGVSDEGETPEETARRECMEEIGVRLRTLEPVGQVWMTPSTSTERVHLFLGEYSSADRVAAGGGAEGENENLKVREVPITELWEPAQRGEMMDAKLFMLLQALRIRRPDLFGEAWKQRL